MMKKLVRFFMVTVVVCVILSLVPMTVFAARRYRDVSAKTCDRTTRVAISYIDAYSGWKDISKNGWLRPRKIATGIDMFRILNRLYDGVVPNETIRTLMAAGNTKITAEFACDRLVELGDTLGFHLEWNWSSNPRETAKMKREKLNRGDLARYIKIFATYDPRLAPRAQLGY